MNNQFTAVCAEYKEIKLKLEELESKSGKTNEHVAKLTNELSEVSEKLEDLKDTFESKDSGIHDTSPLVRIKAALQQVKAEVMTFDLRIGVVSQSLLAARIQVANRRRVSAAQKAKQRRAKGARGLRGKELADDDSLSGDD
jgi:estrogen-related receptor beta like 1